MPNKGVRTTKGAHPLTLKLSVDHELAVYGLGSPVKLSAGQWLKLLATADDIKAFIKENRRKLK